MNMKKMMLLCALILSSAAQAQEVGTIRGKVVDEQNGEGMIGAYVRIDGTELVAFVDINGSYVFNGMAPGTYTVVAGMDGFSDFTVENVVVKAGETTEVNCTLGAAALEQSITVTAELLENTEISLLKHRQKSSSISDAIGGEEISRSGGGNAADAVSKITGASVVGGKYIFIRGLGDRYTSTHLNGVELPTADPDTKSFQADLFPSNILENIVTVKSFTPDKPGNFSGGIVDIGTKNYPNELTLNVSVSSSYNTQVTGDDVLYQPGADRSLPGIVDNGNLQIPSLVTARRNADSAALLDDVSRSFSNVMTPATKKAPYSQGYSVSIGNKVPVVGRDLGFLATLTYGNSVTGYNDRQTARWKLTESADVAGGLVNQSDFISQEGKDSEDIGGLATLNYSLSDTHQIGFNTIYTKSEDTTAHYYYGAWPDQFSSNDNVLESRLLKFSERELTSFQLNGEHFFAGAGRMTLKWNVTDASTSLDEPDTRIFTNHYNDRVINGEDMRIYSIARSNYNNPARYWRDLQEDNFSYNVDANFKINQWNHLQSTLKVGVSYEDKDRVFNELRYEYAFDSGVRYNGDADSIFGSDIVGIQSFDEERNRYTFGSVLQLSPDARGGNYTGTSEINAYYAMLEMPITDRFKLITGARFEKAEFLVENGESIGDLDDNDTLPSLNFIYEPGPKSNVRASYGRTLARPNFREKAPYASYDFIADGIFVGNPDLKRTLIDNYDLRWEWFPRAGELVAASVFYKDFENPIERAYNVRTTSDFGEKTFLNVETATVYGLELELRKRFDQYVSKGESNHMFSFGGNVSFIESEVDIPEDELEFIRQRDPEASATRQLQGQSPYLINLSLNYDNVASGTAASVYYNVFGERLDQVGIGGAPDALEQPRGMLDFTLSQPLIKNLKLKFVAKNLLDEPIEITQEFKGQSFVQTYYKTGSSYKLSINYKR